MNNNFKEFLQITKKLNEEGIIPLLIGSLGLECLTKANWDSGDIDIAVKGDPRGWAAPDEDRVHNWDTICSIMESMQYEMTDLHEHAFDDGIHEVQYGVIDTFPDFAGIAVNELEEICVDDVRFLLPDIEQYLKIYQSSYKDSYRADRTNHKDLGKIEFLKNLISGKRY